jgi:hypothetical protein
MNKVNEWRFNSAQPVMNLEKKGQLLLGAFLRLLSLYIFQVKFHSLIIKPFEVKL